MFLSLQPAGSGQMEEGGEIPVERTSSPYDVVEAFSGLAETSEQIDTDQLAAVADHARRPDPQHPRGVPRRPRRRLPAVRQRRRPRRARSTSCCGNLEQVSKVLDARDEDIIGLMEDCDVLFRALVARRDAVHRLLVSTSTLSEELTAPGPAEPRRTSSPR